MKTITIELTDDQFEALQYIYRIEDTPADEARVNLVISNEVRGKASIAEQASVDSDWNKLTLEEKKEKIKKNG